MGAIETEVLVAFGTLIGGLIAYLTAFSLLQRPPRQPPSDSETAGGSQPDGAVAADHGSKEPPSTHCPGSGARF